MIDDKMMPEDELSELHPQMTPAEAEPEALPMDARPADSGVPEEEQEAPYDGRELPGMEEEPVPAAPPLPAAGQAAEAVAQGAPAPPAPAEKPALPPAPAAPTPPEPDDERRRYWRRILTGSADTIPDAVRARAGQQETGLDEEQREYRLLGTINRSWAADHLGMERELVRADWPRLRAELAGRYKVADDEQELFTALSVEAQDAPRREYAERLYESQYRAALLGREAPALNPVAGEEVPPACARELAEEARRRGLSQRQQYLPLAQELATGLRVFAALEQDAVSAPGVLLNAPELASAVDALAQLDEPRRRIVYAMAQREYQDAHPQGDASFYRTLRRAAGRGATGLGIGAGQALTHATVASLNALGSMLGDERGNALRDKAQALDLRSRIVEETRLLLQEEVQPLDVKAEAGLAGQLLVDAAAGTPTAIAACCGGAGFASLSLSGMGEAVAAARARAPEGSQWLQYLAGVVGGGIQAGIYSGMSRVGGQMLANAIGRFARASGTGAGGYALSGLGVLGAMGLEQAKLLFAGKAAGAAGLGAQELAARLEKTASNIDWKAYGDNALDVESNLREAAMTLPFILIATGKVGLHHFRSRHAVLGDGHALQQWGIDETTRDAIMNEPDITRQSTMLREALRNSRRWSAPGFLAEAARALRLLNTDYYQGFRDPRAVVDFLKLPAQSSAVPRPPFVEYSAENPEHVRLLQERHGAGDKVNPRRLALALKLWDEWTQKAHLVPELQGDGTAEGRRALLPTAARRLHYGLELLVPGGLVPPRLRPGGHYAPQAEAESLAMLRDRVAELHDLSYQVLLSSFPLDALSHSTRSLEHLRTDGNKARQSLLEAVGRCVLRRATGTPEEEALDELGGSVSNYFWRRRYCAFPPGWMNRVPAPYTYKLDEYARETFRMELTDMPPELQDAYRVALGFRACATALSELIPMVPDFRSALARGLSPAEAYVHLLNRELGVDMMQARGVADMLAPYSTRGTDMRAWRLRNEAAFGNYVRLTGFDIEGTQGEAGHKLWRVRRPNGSYTHWHRRRSDAMNEMVALSSLSFLPFSYDRLGALRRLDPERGYDLNRERRTPYSIFTGYDNLCRVALRDTARYWVESAPYALPGFDMRNLRSYVYLGGKSVVSELLMREGGSDAPDTMQVDSLSLTTPMRLAEARFRIYWWRLLNSGMLSPQAAGEQLVKLRLLTPERWQQVQDIAKPLAMPRNPNTPLKDTPPPDIPGMKRALAEHLARFSQIYFLAHLEEMPLPPSAREWFRLAPLCPPRSMEPTERASRLSLKHDDKLLTSVHNRLAVQELLQLLPAVEALRSAERQGLLVGSPLVAAHRNAVGLNRVQNVEQAWCMEKSGGEAMMSTSLAFRHLLEQPLEGWQHMDEVEKSALRRYADIFCRRVPAPLATEAALRGEEPDYLLSGLHNLQDVLADYPALHQYGLETHGSEYMLRRLQPQEPGQGSAPFAEPEYTAAPLYRGGSLQGGYTLGKPEPLPEDWQADARVLPALQLLFALRSFPAQRPWEQREGIHWRGALYGKTGRRPQGLEDENWKHRSPLWHLIDMFWRLHLVNENLPEGVTDATGFGPLQGIGVMLDTSALRNITLYRNRQNPSNLCRLMPGEPDAANPSARTPYLVHTIGGGVLRGTEYLRCMEDMHRSYVPMEEFPHAYISRIRRRDKHKEIVEKSLRYTLDCMLSESTRAAQLEDPKGGIVSLRELLLRFAEDSGLAIALRNVAPHQLSAGQVDALRLARELLLCICGPEPEAAYERFVQVGRRIAADEDARVSVLRALMAASDTLYDSGEKIYQDETLLRVAEETKKPRRDTLNIPTSADRTKLDTWEKKHEAELESKVLRYHTPKP